MSGTSVSPSISSRHTSQFVLSPTSTPSGNPTNHQLQCPWCEKTYDIADSFRKHTRKVHGKGVSVCKICHQIFHSVEERDDHIARGHEGGRENDGSLTEGNVSLVDSELLQLSSSLKVCETCQIGFADQTTLNAHIEDLHPYGCPKCRKRYKMSRGLLRHYKEAHSDEALNVCTRCCQAFVVEAEFKVHQGVCSKVRDQDPLDSRSASPEFHGFTDEIETNDTLEMLTSIINEELTE